MTQSSVTIGPNGDAGFNGPDAVELFRAITLRSAISLHAKAGIIPTRGVTITKMFASAGRYTGKTYRRGQHAQAIADLTIWIETMKSALPVFNSTN